MDEEGLYSVVVVVVVVVDRGFFTCSNMRRLGKKKKAPRSIRI